MHLGLIRNNTNGNATIAIINGQKFIPLTKWNKDTCRFGISESNFKDGIMYTNESKLYFKSVILEMNDKINQSYLGNLKRSIYIKNSKLKKYCYLKKFTQDVKDNTFIKSIDYYLPGEVASEFEEMGLYNRLKRLIVKREYSYSDSELFYELEDQKLIIIINTIYGPYMYKCFATKLISGNFIRDTLKYNLNYIEFLSGINFTI